MCCPAFASHFAEPEQSLHRDASLIFSTWLPEIRIVGRQPIARSRLTAMRPIVEREREFAFFDECLALAKEGAGQSLLLEGAAGIGKTRLLGEASALAARRGFLVLSARGSELEREFAFGVVRQLL